MVSWWAGGGWGGSVSVFYWRCIACSRGLSRFVGCISISLCIVVGVVVVPLPATVAPVVLVPVAMFPSLVVLHTRWSICSTTWVLARVRGAGIAWLLWLAFSVSLFMMLMLLVVGRPL